MNRKDTMIHIQWSGPLTMNAMRELKGPEDYGLYQIYGGHPVYGGSALLYIGSSAQRYLGLRVPEHQWWLGDNCDAGRIEVYVGRLSGDRTPNQKTWNRHIALAERLLIYSHRPAMNTLANLGTLERQLRSVHVLNWGSHRDLLPEVSGARWSSRFDTFPNYHAFSEEE